MEEYLKRIGERIRKQRKKRHMSQETLGEKAGLHYTYIGQVERGEKNMTVGSLLRIAQALDLAPEQLLSESLPELPGILEKGPARRKDVEKAVLRDQKVAKIVADIIRIYTEE